MSPICKLVVLSIIYLPNVNCVIGYIIKSGLYSEIYNDLGLWVFHFLLSNSYPIFRKTDLKNTSDVIRFLQSECQNSERRRGEINN